MGPVLLILRPQPGADATADRAARLGLDSVVAPIFSVAAVEWSPPAVGEVDSVLLTSANAARQAGDRLEPFLPLPCYAVGEATADAARARGFRDVVAGASDGAAVLPLIKAAGLSRPLHLTGRDHVPIEHPDLTVTRRTVYASDAVAALADASREAVEAGSLVLLHSPRAGSTFRQLLDRAGIDPGKVRIAAISDAAAAAAGSGWAETRVSPHPRDEALLELAAKLCKTGRRATRIGG